MFCRNTGLNLMTQTLPIQSNDKYENYQTDTYLYSTLGRTKLSLDKTIYKVSYLYLNGSVQDRQIGISKHNKRIYHLNCNLQISWGWPRRAVNFYRQIKQLSILATLLFFIMISRVFSLRNLQNAFAQQNFLSCYSLLSDLPNRLIRWERFRLSLAPDQIHLQTTSKASLRQPASSGEHSFKIQSLFAIQQCPTMNFGQFLLIEAFLMLPSLITLFLILLVTPRLPLQDQLDINSNSNQLQNMQQMSSFSNLIPQKIVQNNQQRVVKHQKVQGIIKIGFFCDQVRLYLNLLIKIYVLMHSQMINLMEFKQN